MSEREFAEMEAARNSFVESYFGARPQLLRTIHEEKLVEAGFTAAWNTRPAPVQVPAGWKLVPVEPTQDQRISMRCVKAMTADETRAMYAAAINVPAYAAAPSAPAAPAVDAERVSGWVPVGERLPLEPDASVPYRTIDVLATDGRAVHQMEFMAGNIGGPGAWVGWESNGYFIPSEITHWQPLPPPPAIANQEAQDGR